MLRRFEASSPRQLVQQGEVQVGNFAGGRDVHQAGDIKFQFFAKAVKRSETPGATPPFCSSSPVLNLNKARQLALLFVHFALQRFSKFRRSTVSISIKKARTASFALLVCRWPIKCSSRSGYFFPKDSKFFFTLSCTRFSPNTRCPLIQQCSRFFPRIEIC